MPNRLPNIKATDLLDSHLSIDIVQNPPELSTEGAEESWEGGEQRPNVATTGEHPSHCARYKRLLVVIFSSITRPLLDF